MQHFISQEIHVGLPFVCVFLYLCKVCCQKKKKGKKTSVPLNDVKLRTALLLLWLDIASYRLDTLDACSVYVESAFDNYR